MANKKHYRKSIEKMSDDELYGSIRWAGDYISRLISDLERFRKYIQEALNAGKEGLDVESSKNTLYMISEKAKEISKKAWYALFCMAKLYKISVIDKSKKWKKDDEE